MFLPFLAQVASGNSITAVTKGITDRIQLDGGGFAMTPLQRRRLDAKVRGVLAQIGTLPQFWYDFNFSMDLNTTGATKVFNLGTSGATGDGTLVNSTQGVAIINNAQSRKSARFTGTTNADNTRITTTQPTLVDDQTFFAKLRLNSVAVIHSLFGASTANNSAFYIASTTPRLRFDKAGAFNIANGTVTTLATATDYSIALTNSTAKAYAGYINGAVEAMSSPNGNPHAQTFVTNSLSLVTSFSGADRLMADVEGLMIFNSVLTPANIAYLNTLYT